MQLVRRRPNRARWGVGRPVNYLFDDFFAPFFSDRFETGPTPFRPAVDIIEDEASFRVKAELPGIAREDIQLDVKDNVLTLKGERNVEETEQRDQYYRRERSFGSFTRSFALPENVDPEAIKADYKDGVLTITIPKPEKSVPKQITVH